MHRTVAKPGDGLVHNINAVDGSWQQPGPALEFGRDPGISLEDDRRGILEQAPALLAREWRRRRYIEDVESGAFPCECELVGLRDILRVDAAVQPVDCDETRIFLEAA